MNSKLVKKIRKETRREAKKQFGAGIEILRGMVRTRHKFIPRALWVLLFLPLFKTKYLKTIYKYI